MEYIEIKYKDGTTQDFYAKNINCEFLTIKGHASNIIESWTKIPEGVYKIDNYNAVLLSEVVSIRVTQPK